MAKDTQRTFRRSTRRTSPRKRTTSSSSRRRWRSKARAAARRLGSCYYVSSYGGDGLEGVKPTHEIRTSRAGSCTRPADGVSVSYVSELPRHSPEHSLPEQRRALVRPVRALNDRCSGNDRQAGDRQEVCEAVRPLAREPGEEVDKDRREAAGCKSRDQISLERD